jgi:hypothetical protein
VLTGEEKLSLESRIKDLADHAGLSQLLAPWKDLVLLKERSRNSQNSNLLTVQDQMELYAMGAMADGQTKLLAGLKLTELRPKRATLIRQLIKNANKQQVNSTSLALSMCRKVTSKIKLSFICKSIESCS